ncbi:MAG: diaminopimelate epimerase [Bacteroidota bacterium]|nr:diaminopimelate epimerase [Bacteroidota bacterium]
MKNLSFYKYQGTGNDFIMIDNRGLIFSKEDHSLISWLCDRKFGIGADGIILLEKHPECDFEMVYFNPDASQSLCGNGCRCAVMFAQKLGIISDQTHFRAIDGFHDAIIENDLVHLKMADVHEIKFIENDVFINTGSPHHICFVENLPEKDVIQEGRKIRYSNRYKDGGTNVNFIYLQQDNSLSIRTYERGVESETLSCGTGAVAASLAASLHNFDSPVRLHTLGGKLQVSFKKVGEQKFEDIYLIGPAELVFTGTVKF